MRLQKHLSLLALVLCTAVMARGAEPSGYYSSCEGKNKAALLTALYKVVGPHTTVSYKGLLDLYKTSDVDANGKIWDMYSTKRWNTGETCGNYSNVGDCYNREHSFPKSWFNDASPMVSDAFHIYPTDGKVNGQRSNFPYGECASGTTLPSHGGVKALGKLGTCTFPGYSGKVFEPDDEYKGDFARSYFYMAAAYNDRISSWSSDMLAGNSYPAYKQWSINLLLKWHRQDPVSDKERARNEAVYARQHNRNPFIDHPELAEYIWGDKMSASWSLTGEAEPIFTAPVNGATISIGTTAVGVSRSYTLMVKGKDINANPTVTVSGQGFSATPSSLTAAAVNGSGSAVTVTYSPAAAGNATGKLTIASGSASVTVNLSATAVNGLPALPATEVTENSFCARWSNVDDDDATYRLDVMKDGASITGYPVDVVAADEQWDVTGLQPETTYTYTLASATHTSNVVTVTTATPEPSIQVLTDGDISLVTTPGIPSEAITISLDIDNISGNVTVAVKAPFEVSDDKATWDTTVELVPGEDTFYLRLNGNNAGIFSSPLRLSAGTYVNDDVTVTGNIRPIDDFCETFEIEDIPSELGSYATTTFEGVAATWSCVNMGMWASDGGYDNSDRCVRFGKTSTSSLTIAQDRPSGIGSVSFMARNWSANEGEVTLTVDYSTDHGATWTTGPTVTIPSGTTYNEYTAVINNAAANRFRLQQSAGARFLVDDIKASSFTTGIGGIPTGEPDNWDAYSRDGNLVIETQSPATVWVYSIDAMLMHTSTVNGRATIALPAGFYIVVNGDDAHRVVVK